MNRFVSFDDEPGGCARCRLKGERAKGGCGTPCQSRRGHQWGKRHEDDAPAIVCGAPARCHT